MSVSVTRANGKACAATPKEVLTEDYGTFLDEAAFCGNELVLTIKAHLAKGDKAQNKANDHYFAAGQYLLTLKERHTGNWYDWEAFLKERIGIGKSRASELMQIADGRKTVEQVNERRAESMRQVRDQSSPPRGGEPVDPIPSDQSPMPARHHELATNENFEDDTFEPDETVEKPKKVLMNVLDSIKQAKAVAEAYRKILKVSPFNRGAKKEISDEIESLIRKWRSVQSALATYNG